MGIHVGWLQGPDVFMSNEEHTRAVLSQCGGERAHSSSTWNLSVIVKGSVAGLAGCLSSLLAAAEQPAAVAARDYSCPVAFPSARVHPLPASPTHIGDLWPRDRSVSECGPSPRSRQRTCT